MNEEEKQQQDQQMREWIDNATYQELLYKSRHSPIGDPYFQLEMGDYFLKVMAEKKAKLSSEEQVKASKNVGWN